MIISQADRDKRLQLNEAYHQLLLAVERYDLEKNYGAKFCTILKMASMKLVGCEDKIGLVELTSKYRDWAKNKDIITKYHDVQLRRDGLKVAFGDHNASKYQDPDSGSRYYAPWVIQWLNDTLSDGTITKYDAVIRDLKELMTKTKSKAYKMLQFPEGITRLIEIMQDIAATKLHKISRNTSSRNRDKLEHKVSAKFVLPEAEDGSGYTPESLNIESIDVLMSPNSATISLVGSNDTWEIGSNDNLCDEGFTPNYMNLISYLRVSEEPIYSLVMGAIKDATEKLNKEIAIKTKSMNAVCTKWGQYLVMKEL